MTQAARSGECLAESVVALVVLRVGVGGGSKPQQVDREEIRKRVAQRPGAPTGAVP